MSVEFTLNCQVEVSYGTPWSSPYPLHLCRVFIFWWRWAGSFPLALLTLQNRDSKRPTDCSVATRDCLPWHIFDLLLLNSNPPARLRIRRAKGFKGSEFHPTALKLASDQATASLKILQWLLITPRKKDSSILWLALTNLFSLITHCSPVSQSFLDPCESRDPSCFRILLALFPHPMTFLFYSFFHHQVNHYFIRKTFYNTLDEFKSLCFLLLKQLHLLFQSIYHGLELCI